MKKRIIILIVLFVSLILIGIILSVLNRPAAEAAAVAEKVSTMTEKLTGYMASYQEGADYPYSGVILVAEGDKILLHEGYGYADREQELPNDTSTVFGYGSISKSITATAIMQLVERGELSLSGYITDYIPSFSLGSDITIHHLLTHTSGLQREGKFTYNDRLSLEEHAAYLNDYSIAYKPGVRFMYSNAGYIMLAMIIERVSGLTYDEYLYDNIFFPLGMRRAFTSYDDSHAPNQAIGYRIIPSGTEELTLYNLSRVIGAANILGTADDLFRYARSYTSGELLTEESIAAMTTAYNEGYGYGWEITETYGEKQFFHGGTIGGSGYNSLIIIFPESGHTLIFLTNNDDRTALETVAYAMEGILFGEDAPI